MIDWKAIDTVLLDMDGTLLDLHFDNFFWQQHLPTVYAAAQDRPEAQSRADLLARFEAQRGTLDWYSIDYWSEQLGLDIPALKHEMRHRIRYRPFADDFLQQLHGGRWELLLVTNAHRKTLDIKLSQVPLDRWFDHLVVSHELDAPKEDIVFWQNLQQLHPFDPQRTLLIDDTESVLAAAQSYGIAHLLTLLQPDSELQQRIDTRFPGIHHFDEIMPDAQNDPDLASHG